MALRVFRDLARSAVPGLGLCFHVKEALTMALAAHTLYVHLSYWENSQEQHSKKRSTAMKTLPFISLLHPKCSPGALDVEGPLINLINSGPATAQKSLCTAPK